MDINIFTTEQKPLLRPDPIALCVGIVAVVAAFDATTPTHTRLGIIIAVPEDAAFDITQPTDITCSSECLTTHTQLRSKTLGSRYLP